MVSRGKTKSIKDVAEAAGVSTATVSRALSEPGRVTEQTRARVMAAVQALHYTPNAAARNLRARRAMTVLILVPRLDSAFHAEFISRLEGHLGNAGYGTIIGDLAHQDPDGSTKERRLADFVLSGKIDGVITMIGRIPGQTAEMIGQPPVPTIALCTPLRGLAGATFMVDERAACLDATRRMIARGHKRLVYLGAEDGHVNDVARFKGFTDAVKEAGAIGERWSGRFSMVSGEAQAARFLKSRSGATGIVACSDANAIGFMRGLREAGKTVPDDVSVIGFDGIEIAPYIAPGLATMRQPQDEIGRLGVDRLIAQMRGQPTAVDSTIHLVNAVFQPGGSLGSAPERG